MLYSKIKAICRDKNISVASVERESGLSNGTISKWNDVSPTIGNLTAVAKVLGISVTTLMKDD